ncbi:hypothetical protein LJC20_02465 [Eubacteriales bacterium OttesenSCG-928-M02]|nr:hypothetical protein [Eubacteriales bacterium OttesenSCG-928-M02]
MDKEIRFIDPNYNELFRIPDGGNVVITHPGGEQGVNTCKYIDDTHFYLDGECLHICQFAEIMMSNGSMVEPEKEPELVGNYHIIRRIPVNDKVYVMGHNPDAAQPYATWQGYRDTPDKDWGHYFSKRADAWGDLLCRADAERTGVPYDYTKQGNEKAHER